MSKTPVKKFIFYLFLVFSLFPWMTFQVLEGLESKKRNLHEVYTQHCQTLDDLSTHLPLLRQLATECSSVTEISRSPISQWGILQGLSESSYQQRSYVGIHLAFPPRDQFNLAKKLAKENDIQFTFWRVNDLHIMLEPTDMLFIHSVPTYCHLRYELETFSSKIGKYICIYYPTPWENQDDMATQRKYGKCVNSYQNTTKKGVRTAIKDFLNNHPEWALVKHLTNQGIFIILARIDENDLLPPTYDPRIDAYLKNKIILCTGPALNRFNLLKKTTESDLELIPFKKIFVTTQDPRIMNISFKGKKPICELIPNQGKQLDCTNCIFINLRNVANDPDVEDDDIILFKHETVFINDMHLIKKAIEKLMNGFSLIDRNRIRGSYQNWWSTDVFFIKVSAIRKLVQNYKLITRFPRGIKICEHFFGQHLIRKIRNIYEIRYDHDNGYFTELGFYHLPSKDNQKVPWDKKNYDQIFK